MDTMIMNPRGARVIGIVVIAAFGAILAAGMIGSYMYLHRESAEPPESRFMKDKARWFGAQSDYLYKLEKINAPVTEAIKRMTADCEAMPKTPQATEGFQLDPNQLACVPKPKPPTSNSTPAPATAPPPAPAPAPAPTPAPTPVPAKH